MIISSVEKKTHFAPQLALSVWGLPTHLQKKNKNPKPHQGAFAIVPEWYDREVT